jgi:hypothetical protein
MVLLVAFGRAAADESAVEFWPEVDVWLRLSPAWRASLFVPISKNIETAYREGNVILQADYAWGKVDRLRRARLMDDNRAQVMRTLLVRGGYLGGRSLGDQGESYTERTMLVELHVRTPLKGGVLLQHRLRSDLRWLGEAPDFSTRFRYRLQAEKEYVAGRTSVVPYANAEAYFDSRYATVNRVRLIGGASVAWSPRFAFEGNWTYQHDTRSSTEHLDALNLILHVYFEKRGKPQGQSRQGRRAGPDGPASACSMHW